MAAVTATAASPASPPAIPARRRPISLQLSEDMNGELRPLPARPPVSETARMRPPPVSPVQVNFQPENWAEPSSANIENGSEHVLTPPPGAGRDLTGAFNASALSPHAPQSSSTQAYGIERPAPVASVAGRSRQMEDRPLPILNVGSVPESAERSIGALRPLGAATPETDDGNTYGTAPTRPWGNDCNDLNRNTTVRSTAATSTSSFYGANEAPGFADPSPKSSLEDGAFEPQSAPQLQYHDEIFLPLSAGLAASAQQEPLLYDPRSASTPDLVSRASPVNRHLTPNSNNFRQSSLPRPHSSYSVYSDYGSHDRSSPGAYGGPHHRVPSSNSRKSPDTRPTSYADMLNLPYPQPAPSPINMNNVQLRNAIGSNASLLSTQKTLEMYRQNVKKTNDMSIQYSFAVFLISTAQEQGLSFDEPAKRKSSPHSARDQESPSVESDDVSPQELVREARSILQRLSNAGYPFAQYYMADGFASGLFSKGKEDYNAAFPLFVLAAKHGHAESAYRTALCYEFGWGCRKDPTKAIQYLRTAASKRHPGAMTRLGRACLSGDLGEKRYREGVKWMKLATEASDTIYNGAPYHLACMYETGYGADIFKDESYAAELFTQAAELGHPDASFRMGDAYEHGRLNCPRDPALSVHFYTGAAEHGHPAAMMGLCAWYMVGAEPVLERDEEEAYEWARRAADLGYAKAQYAAGYFTEMGIGCRRDILEANVWYVKAADSGEERAQQRLSAIRAAASGGNIPLDVEPSHKGKLKKKGSKEESCGIM